MTRDDPDRPMLARPATKIFRRDNRRFIESAAGLGMNRQRCPHQAAHRSHLSMRAPVRCAGAQNRALVHRFSLAFCAGPKEEGLGRSGESLFDAQFGGEMK